MTIAGLVIIVIGVAVTGIGIWRQSKASPRLPPSQTASISPPPSSTVQNIPTAISNAPPPRPTRFTAYEKEQRLRAVDEIYNVIATQLQPAYSEGRKIVYDVYRGPDDKAEQRLTEYAIKVQGAFDNLNALLKKYTYFTDIVEAATKNTFNDVAATHGVKNLIPDFKRCVPKYRMTSNGFYCAIQR
jgi:hypothetical protein